MDTVDVHTGREEARVPAQSHRATGYAHGRELFYRDAMRNLVAVPVTAGEGFATGAPRALFPTDPYYSEGNTTSYDVSLDGTRFLMIKQPIDQTLVVVVNWIEELRER